MVVGTGTDAVTVRRSVLVGVGRGVVTTIFVVVVALSPECIVWLDEDDEVFGLVVDPVPVPVVLKQKDWLRLETTTVTETTTSMS